MRRFLLLLLPCFVASSFTAALAACASSASPARTADSPDSAAAGPVTEGHPDGSTPLPDGGACCPISPTPMGCMAMGGPVHFGACLEECDFWCSTNWRVVKDDAGCDEWTYDLQTPCSPPWLDAGARDASHD